MWPAFPASEYYGGSAPSRTDRSTMDPARSPQWRCGIGADPRRFPCSLLFAQRRRSPTVSLRHRHGYPAAFHHGLRVTQWMPTQEFLTTATLLGDECAPQPAHPPDSTDRRQIKGRRTLVPLVLLSTTLTQTAAIWWYWPRPGLVRALRSAPAPPGTNRPLATLPRCEEDNGEGLSPPLEQREVDTGRPAGIATGGSPRAASRTRRAPHSAPGSPQVPVGNAGQLMLCSAMVSGSVLPGSSSGARAPWPGRTVPRRHRRAICRSVDVAPSMPCADACVPAT